MDRARRRRTAKTDGIDLIMPDWFYRAVLDDALVLTIDPRVFRPHGRAGALALPHRSQAWRPARRHGLLRSISDTCMPNQPAFPRSGASPSNCARLSLATRSDLTIEALPPGATWIDRQLLAKDPALSGGGFGAEVREAMDRRIDHLARNGMAERQGQRVVFARDLINTLRRQELEGVASKLSAETGLAHRPSAEGEHVSGIYRQRVTLSSGRFAMIDDGMGFQLVPWRPALEQQLGKQVAGVMAPGGGVDWNFGRKRGLGI